MTIKVFDIEKDLGLEDSIINQSSIAFVAPIQHFEQDSKINKELIKLNNNFYSMGGVKDPDLYHVYSVLVSTVWNRNDDVFNKDEVWLARETPKFKPTNLEHDEQQIVGNIVDCWPVDLEFNLIDKDINIEKLPEEYHLLVSSVIFRQWQNPQLKARAEKLIGEIESGNKFVSMECIFKGFDYGVVSPDGANHVVARNETTAFLTQHLRAYGGKGSYQEHKIGRVLRNITFSGKGFVDRPANPDSIIFDKKQIFSFANASISDKSLFLKENGVTSNKEKQLYSENISITENQMTTEILNDQIKELKEALASVNNENKQLNEKLSQANVSQYELKIKELESAIAESEAKINNLTVQLNDANAKTESLQQTLNSKTEALEKVEAEMHSMKEDQKKKGRKDKMVKAGMSEEDAEVKYESFANMSDDQFDAFIELITSFKPTSPSVTETQPSEAAMDMKKKKKKDEEMMKEEDDTMASEVVDNETEKGDHSVASTISDEETQTSAARASLQKWVEECIMKNK